MTRGAFFKGMRDGAPFLIVIVPFGMLFGVAAREAGWDIAQIIGMSVLVVAGASQFTALQLLQDQAPTLIVILTATAVNLRHAMYSASIAPHLGPLPLWRRALVAYALVDQTYGAAMNRYALEPQMSHREKAAYFAGVATQTCGVWYLASVAGAVIGSGLPPALALDFAVPVAFISLFAPALRSLPHLAAALVSAAGALALAAIPYGLGLIAAAGAAMATGAAVEIWQERQR